MEEICPRDIDTSRYFWDAFGGCNRELIARQLVTFFQKKNEWGPAAADEIRTSLQGCTLEEIIGFGWLEKAEEAYCAADSFIRTCHASSPKK